ncbi:MAG: restriction endonuclease, partial [Candidatus Bathyarchaeota archaeon]|nr:restriction endonuclease [Candidatus Bathyarchaeota archaeon]
MSVELGDESLIEKAELVMAVRGYKDEERRRWDEGIDYVASHGESDDKVLLRVVTEPKSISGIAGSDVVNEMSETMKREGYDKGVLISRRFTNSAKDKMRREGIQMISEKSGPWFELEELYVTMQEYIDG